VKDLRSILGGAWPMFRDQPFCQLVDLLVAHAQRTPDLADALCAVDQRWGWDDALRYAIDDYHANTDGWLTIGPEWIARLDDADARAQANQFIEECREAWEYHLERDEDWNHYYRDAWDDSDYDEPQIIAARQRVAIERWLDGDPHHLIPEAIVVPVEYEYGYDHGLWFYPGELGDLIADWRSGQHPPGDYFCTKPYRGHVVRGMSARTSRLAYEQNNQNSRPPFTIDAHLHEHDDSSLAVDRTTYNVRGACSKGTVPNCFSCCKKKKLPYPQPTKEGNNP
jgi:hypothetical protein